MKSKQMYGQINITDYINSVEHVAFAGCEQCVCEKCLWHESQRCPFGCCYDDKRAFDNPYSKAYPDKSPRTTWSNWNKPGEQEHWCRGGICYPVRYCDKFEKFTGCHVKECLDAIVVLYQDGYIECPLVDMAGCEECYRRLEEKQIF